LEHYNAQGRLLTVDAEGSVDTVFQQISTHL
jgi:adenylate kinase family enzyme